MPTALRCPRCGSYKTLVIDLYARLVRCLADGCGQIFRDKG